MIQRKCGSSLIVKEGRLKEILKNLEDCDSFADVGCDHGYISEMMLSLSKCGRAYLSDISAKSVQKAAPLTEKYKGRALLIVCDGLTSVPECEQVLIAGMGGREIIKILKSAPFKPVKLTLQPMKDSENLRRFLIESGYSLERDYTFFAANGKYYDILKAKAKSDSYTEREYRYGRDNLNFPSESYVNHIGKMLKITSERLESAKSGASKAQLTKKYDELKEVFEYVCERFARNN